MSVELSSHHTADPAVVAVSAWVPHPLETLEPACTHIFDVVLQKEPQMKYLCVAAVVDLILAS